MSSEEIQAHRIFVEESLLGVFGINEANEIVEKAIYPQNPEQIAAALRRQQDVELTKEVIETVEKLIQKGFNRFIFTNKDLAEAVREHWSVDVEFRTKTKAGDYLRDSLEDFAVDLGLTGEASNLYEISHSVSVMMTRKAVGQALSERETIISNTVHLIVELDKALNALSNMLREWYGLHSRARRSPKSSSLLRPR